MATCVVCHSALVIEVEGSDGEGDHGESSKQKAPADTVPDDAELACNCHFHCCDHDISSTSGQGAPQILCNLHNEGGLQTGLDILPLLTEEAYLRAHPEDRICRAFLEFCREGDVAAIVELLRSCDEADSDDEDGVFKRSSEEVLRFQDPIGDLQSGLHAAVAGSSREVAWLLLLLASEYPELEFPALVYQEASALGVMRSDQTGKVDIRSLRDAQGRTAEDIANEVQGVWLGWTGNGRLAA